MAPTKTISRSPTADPNSGPHTLYVFQFVAPFALLIRLLTKKKLVGTYIAPPRRASLHLSRPGPDRPSRQPLLLQNQLFPPAPAPPNL